VGSEVERVTGDGRFVIREARDGGRVLVDVCALDGSLAVQLVVTPQGDDVSVSVDVRA
jgi:ribosomal protein RSM22 (predicted rRNA methylase)